MSKILQMLLEENESAIREEGMEMIVSLEDGFCIIEKGLEETPFLIRVETFDVKLPLTIKDFIEGE
jgi:hypothetical protein